MKHTFLLVILVILEALASNTFAGSSKPINQTFIRPYSLPKDMTSVHDALLGLYKQNGVTRHEFEYSLPAKTELIVKVVFLKNGLVDRSASGQFYLTSPSDFLQNAGSFLIDRTYPTCKCPQVHNNWHIYFSTGKANYGYTFLEGTPNNYKHSSSEQMNVIIGKSTKHENIIFAEEDKNKKFSLIVRVKCVPMLHYNKYNRTGSVIRVPFAI